LIKCLADNDSTELLMFESELNVKKAMNSTSLSKLSKTIDKKNVVKAITYLILRLSNTLNISKKFNEEQASILALDLTEIFSYETLEDVVLMFKYARQGKFSKTFERLDSEVVTRIWVPEYLELKSIERENQHNKSKGEKNGMSNFNWSQEDLNKFEVKEEVVLPTKISERMKEKLYVENPPEILLKDRKQYLTEMYYQVRNMSLEQLKSYLIKADVSNTNKTSKLKFDQDVYTLVENEMDRRNKTLKQ